jgi:hypothetical protein
MSERSSPSLAADPYDRPREPMIANNRALMGWALLQAALFAVPLIVLGKAIGWPASLRLPAAEALPLIAREALSVQIGYWAYMLTALATIPLAVALRAYAHSNGVRGLLVDTAALLGAAARVFKMLGIVRWLVAMPGLATTYVTTKDAVTKTVIETGYTMLNGYAGAVGELLGVQLVSGLWLIATGVILMRVGLRWTGIAGLLIGVLFLVTCARTVFPQLNILQAIAPPLGFFWFPMLAFAVWRCGCRANRKKQCSRSIETRHHRPRRGPRNEPRCSLSGLQHRCDCGMGGAARVAFPVEALG